MPKKTRRLEPKTKTCKERQRISESRKPRRRKHPCSQCGKRMRDFDSVKDHLAMVEKEDSRRLLEKDHELLPAPESTCRGPARALRCSYICCRQPTMNGGGSGVLKPNKMRNWLGEWLEERHWFVQEAFLSNLTLQIFTFGTFFARKNKYFSSHVIAF